LKITYSRDSTVEIYENIIDQFGVDADVYSSLEQRYATGEPLIYMIQCLDILPMNGSTSDADGTMK